MTSELTNAGRQWKLEAEAARLGTERLRERTRADEQREYSSGTLWGRKVINKNVQAIAKEVEESARKIRLGTAVAGGVKIIQPIMMIEPEVLAAIAAKRILDQIGMGKDEKGRYQNAYPTVCVAVGSAVEHEARFRWYEKTAPEHWNYIKSKYFKSTTGTQQKSRVASIMMKRRGFVWDSWSRTKRHSVGAWLLNCVAKAAGWFTLRRVETRAKKGSQNLVEMTDQLKDLKGTIMTLAELYAPLTWPMVCPPADWGREQAGGYLTNELRQGFSLIRGAKVARTLGDTPIDMLNTLQRVAYRINPVTLALMHQLSDRQIDLKSFVMRDNLPTPPRPDTEDKEELMGWRKKCKEIHDDNASLKGRRYRTLETLSVANRFAAEPEIYIPWSFDWRGRVYPIPVYMSPQGSDMEKSLYLFAKSRPVTEDAKRWLAIQVANTAGQDKLTLEDRVKWTEEHLDEIKAIAIDPLGAIPLLESWSDPWCGVAACDEYYHCVVLGDRTETSLPVATDATCSGLQHLAAMTLDAATAHLVNVSPTPIPQDAYKAVLNRTIEKLRPGHPDLADWASEVGRALAKRVVMTVPYAAEERSNRGYILKAIKAHEKGKPESEQRRVSAQELTIITRVMLSAMREIVPGPIGVMSWAKAAARDFFIDESRTHIEWMSPSGFPVKQDKRKLNLVRVKTQLLGDCVWTQVGDGYKEVAVGKHASGIMPNFIHSCDAALLHQSFAGFDQPFTLIHDSILTTATDMGYMSGVIREQFVEIYKDLPLQTLAKALDTELPEGMVIGDLDISKTTDSIYFFC